MADWALRHHKPRRETSRERIERLYGPQDLSPLNGQPVTAGAALTAPISGTGSFNHDCRRWRPMAERAIAWLVRNNRRCPYRNSSPVGILAGHGLF